MFLSRKILIANFAAAVVLAPVAVHALGANGAGDVPPMARMVAPAQPTVAAELAKPAATLAEPKCARVRVVYPGPAALAPACPIPAAIR